MKTMYGLTETQMWEVYRECERQSWRDTVISISDNLYPDFVFTAWEIEEATTNAIKEYNFVDVRAEVETEIIEQALAEIYNRASEY